MGEKQKCYVLLLLSVKYSHLAKLTSGVFSFVFSVIPHLPASFCRCFVLHTSSLTFDPPSHLCLSLPNEAVLVMVAGS